MTLITCSAYIIPIYTVKCGVLLVCSQVFQNLYSNRQASHTFLFMSPYDQAPKTIRKIPAKMLYPKSVIGLWGDCPLVSCSMLLA